MRELEKTRILDSFSVYSIPNQFRTLIEEAIESDKWDWYEDNDGCTLVPEYWIGKCHPACLVHDYMSRTGAGGKESDLIFKYLLRAYGFPKYHAGRWYIGVRIGWITYLQFKNRNNKRPLSYTETYVYENLTS